jgi:two-component system, sensor histidine kinase PdtaS
LQNDINVTRNVIGFISLVIALFAISDFLFFNFSAIFFVLLALRIGLIFFSIVVVKYLSRLREYRLYDRACLFWMTLSVILILAINLSRPQNFLPQIVILDIGILVAYLIVPTKFVYQAVPASIFSIGQVIIILFIFNPDISTGISTSMLSVLFSNIIGAVTSWQIHSYRWELYQNNMKNKDSERLITIGQTAGMVGHDIETPFKQLQATYICYKTISNRSLNRRLDNQRRIVLKP